MPYTTQVRKILPFLQSVKSKVFMCSFMNGVPINIKDFTLNDNALELTYAYAVDHMAGTNKVFYKNEYMGKLTIDLEKSVVFKDAFARTNINYNSIKLVL